MDRLSVSGVVTVLTRVVVATAMVGFSHLAASCAEPARPPNVVLIVADDLGWADLGCYGSKYHRTPQLDRLAAGGRRFTQAYAACPVCSPTRASLMTGKTPGRLHLTDWLPGRRDMPTQRLLRPQLRQQLPLEEVTVAEVFSDAGYATAHVGKWHLGGAGYEPTRQGFDVNVAGDARGSPASYFAPFGKGDRAIPGLADAPAGEYLTDRLTDEALRLIENNRARPFFLYLAHYAVHIPLAAKSDLQSHYAPWDGVPHGRQENPIYAAMLESVDEGVGRILARLAELELAERTIVIFTSDNGGLATREGPHTPATINAPLREGKGWLYEGGVRVPLIVSWPGHIGPGVVETPVFSGDVPVTALALCGQKFPVAVDGVDLTALVLDDKPPLPARSLYWHYPHYANQGSRPGGAVRDGDWKLIEFYETGRRELFNLARDPSESKNLAADEPEQVERLAAKLAAWRREIDAQMPSPNPDYMPNPADKQGVIVLPARTADVHGVMLRYEPLPHKNTLGYWVRPDDWAEWQFDVPEPGEYRVEALVGCGDGSGGSKVRFRAAEQTREFVVPETGGFQQFESFVIGKLTFARAGRYQLEVRAVSKLGPAVMDLREVKLTPRGAE
ncbi:MAG TPA: sulfatase-like hydrolase/transferase [Pirellulales bacterium]|nr:sulfatase-like hydrolase/transferase [Pirellulales bacterium]